MTHRTHTVMMRFGVQETPTFARAKRTISLFYQLILTLFIASICNASTCPSSKLVQSLAAGEHQCECGTSNDAHFGGWEITCFVSIEHRSPSSNSMVSNGANETNSFGTEAIESMKETDDEPSADLLPMASRDFLNEFGSFKTVPIAFTIKYIPRQAVIIECHDGIPRWRPALFQGFGLEDIDTFKLQNCEMPSVPFHLLLYRTRLVSGETRIAALKALKVESLHMQHVNITHFRTLFAQLEDLELLSMENIALILSVPRSRARRQVTALPSSTLITNSARPRKRKPSRLVNSNSTLNTPQGSTSMLTTPMPTIINSTTRSRSNNSNVSSLPTTTNSASTITASNASSNSTTQMTSSSSLNAVTGTTSSMLPSSSSSSSSSIFPATAFSPSTIVNRRTSSSTTNGPRLPSTISTATVQPAAASPSSQRTLGVQFVSLFPSLKSLQLRAFLPQVQRENAPLLQLLLQQLQHLESLRLSGNVLHALPAAMFSTLSSLRTLYLARNKIEQIHPLTFQGLRSLEVLEAPNNAITTLHQATFNELTALRILRLRHNRLTQLPPRMFIANTQLVQLDLAANPTLDPLSDDLFAGLSSLQNLSVADCGMKRFAADPIRLFNHLPALRNLGMRNNRLTRLELPGLFGGCPQLTSLDLAYNDIVILHPHLFNSNSSRLIDLNMYANNIEQMPPDVFAPLRSLRTLNLGFNNLTDLPPRLLLPLSSLVTLDLNQNQLTKLANSAADLPSVFGVGSALRSVNLAKNALNDFQELNEINWSLYLSLQELDLSNNRYEGSVQLPLMYASRVRINLRGNRIARLLIDEWTAHRTALLSAGEEALADTQAQHAQVFIADNPLICDCSLYSLLRHVREASQRKQQDTLPVVRLDVEAAHCAQPPALATTSLASLDEQQLSCTVTSSVCPNECTCDYSAARRALTLDCRQLAFENVPETLLQVNEYSNVTTEGGQPVGSLASVQLLLQHNHIAHVAQLQPLLAASSTSSSPIALHVHLDNNTIAQLPTKVFERNTSELPVFKLETLSLTHNRLRMVPIEVLDQIKALRSQQQSTLQLYLGANPYNCTPIDLSLHPTDSCDALQLKNWLTANYALVSDLSDMHCDGADNRRGERTRNSSAQLITQPDHILCIPDADDANFTIVLLVLTCCVITLALLVTLLYFKNRQTILAFIYIHVHPVFVCLSFHEEDLDQEKLYDAFVSYSSADRDVVMQLIEQLEQPSKRLHNSIHFLQSQGAARTFHEASADKIVPEHLQSLAGANKVPTTRPNANGFMDPESADSSEFFQLCIHERDWLPGQLISWNIINSVRNSRRTIIILSKDFIESIWFQIEFHTAYYQMLEDKMDRLIVIIRGDIPDKTQLDKDLAFLLSTKTYLVWGEKWFWEKLRYSLPHKRSTGNEDASRKRMAKPLVNGNGKKWPEFGTYGTAEMPQRDNKVNLQQRVDSAIADYYQLNAGSAVKGKTRGKTNSAAMDALYSEFGRSSTVEEMSTRPVTNLGQVNPTFESFETETRE